MSGSPFDRIKQNRPDGSEFWSARHLQGLMGYAKWQNLMTAIARAQQSASNTGMDVAREFEQVAPFTDSGNRSGGGQFASGTREDFQLSRQAAYLVAMNGDPNKPEVAAAQAYFAARTVQAEVVERRASKLPAWAQALHVLVDQQAAIEVEQQRQAVQVREIDARVASVEGAYGEFAALAYAKLNDLPTDRPSLALLGKRASAVMRAAGQEPRKRQDATFGLINVYPTWALDAALAELTEDA
ncbi:hypothetical protein VSH64_25075 [Amycolatopsis rhabdoformis]|uniref:DNA damage-inducible protein D n=1 Tax=Amycolatopsis rhabdoformis TaxID=1448059 RepID=A0ABZ1HX16_9PSEU|nr:hypothetical protein [Amycolatopsis rhabdoformis]WSE26151.1 hypothetical protein VSH64_25075 [Amycolatopsis rhabdoformis]